jgi:hypothetical protein
VLLERRDTPLSAEFTVTLNLRCVIPAFRCTRKEDFESSHVTALAMILAGASAAACRLLRFSWLSGIALIGT